MSLFLASCKKPFPKQKWNNTVREMKLAQEEDRHICQGHGLIRLLQYVMNPNDRLGKRMAKAYSPDDFSTTQLYRNISSWEKTRGVRVLTC